MTSRRRPARGRRRKWTRTVDRERFRLAPGEEPPSESVVHSMDAVVAALMQRLGVGQAHWFTILEESWPDLVGKDICAHARPGRFADGVLTVFVESPVWLNELSRYARPALEKKIRERFGRKCRSVRFQLDPEATRR